MPIIPKYRLKDLFKTGDLISQESMNDLIDSTYNPELKAGANIFLTTIDTPSGKQTTISSSSGSGGGGNPGGSNTQIQYNENGLFGADANFTRDSLTGDFLAAHNTNNSRIFIGDNAINPIAGSAGISMLKTTTTGINAESFIGIVDYSAAVGDATAFIGSVSTDTLINTAGIFDIEGTIIVYNDNLLDRSCIIGMDNSQMELSYRYADVVGHDKSAIELKDTGIMFNFGSDRYTFPTADGSLGQVMTTDGSGQLSWSSVGSSSSLLIKGFGNSGSGPENGDYRFIADSTNNLVIQFYTGGAWDTANPTIIATPS